MICRNTKPIRGGYNYVFITRICNMRVKKIQINVLISPMASPAYVESIGLISRTIHQAVWKQCYNL
jgi:hypothetical protein